MSSRRGGWRIAAPELRPRTVEDYQWALSYHLLPFFKDHRLREITVREVDRYKAVKVKAGQLGASQINKTLKLLAMVIDTAIEYEIVTGANPARGRRRRVKADKVQRSWVEPEQLIALLLTMRAEGPQADPRNSRRSRAQGGGGRRPQLA